MAKVDIFKTQRIGGKRPQFMQSIGTVAERAEDDSPTCADASPCDPTPILHDEDWMAIYDDEIGYWESIRPFWF